MLKSDNHLHQVLSHCECSIKPSPIGLLHYHVRLINNILYPDYNRDTVDNDLALLELPGGGADLGRAAALACLPGQGERLPTIDHCTIIGWGKEKKSHFFGTEVLHEARVSEFLFQALNFPSG